MSDREYAQFIGTDTVDGYRLSESSQLPEHIKLHANLTNAIAIYTVGKKDIPAQQLAYIAVKEMQALGWGPTEPVTTEDPQEEMSVSGYCTCEGRSLSLMECSGLYVCNDCGKTRRPVPPPAPTAAEADTEYDWPPLGIVIANAMSTNWSIASLAQAVSDAIAADPSILDGVVPGWGKLPTRSELMACREVDSSTGYPVRVFGDDAVDYLVEAGWAIEDPDQQPPEPTLREQVASMIQAGMDNGQYPDAIMRSLLAEFDITPKAAAEGDVSCG